MRAELLLALLLSACAASLPTPPPPPPDPPRLIEPAPPPPPPPNPAPLVRRRYQAEVSKAARLMQSETIGASVLLRIRGLDEEAERSVRALERDGGRHVTPIALLRARTAVAQLAACLDQAEP